MTSKSALKKKLDEILKNTSLEQLKEYFESKGYEFDISPYKDHGFYWVLMDGKWTLAKYYESCDSFEIIGSDCGWKADELDRIHEVDVPDFVKD